MNFNIIEIFKVLLCAFYKKLIELYGFALRILGVLAPYYTLKSNKEPPACNISGKKFQSNQFTVSFLAKFFLNHSKIKLMLHGTSEKYFVNTMLDTHKIFLLFSHNAQLE